MASKKKDTEAMFEVDLGDPFADLDLGLDDTTTVTEEEDGSLIFDLDDDVVEEVVEVVKAAPKKKAPIDPIPLFDEDPLDEIAEASKAPVVGFRGGAKPMDFSDLITDIDDSVEYLTWLIYGKNGTGKTSLLATTEGMLILAAEEGTLSIRETAKGRAKKIKIDSWDKLEKVYWLLHNGVRKASGIEIDVKGGKFLVKSVGFDTVDRLAEVCMRNVVLGNGGDSKANVDILKKTLKNWGEMSDRMKFWLQQFETLPIQKIFLCQEASNTEEIDSDEASIYPALNKSLRTYLLSDADIIARTYIRKGDKGMEFKLSAKPNDKYVTKDRTNTLKSVITNPSLDTVYETVFGK